jgi:hypothetical protein
MLKKIISVRSLMFASIVALGWSVTGCDFGNKTNDTHNAGTGEGTIHEGDNQDDESAAAVDTAEVNSFR